MKKIVFGILLSIVFVGVVRTASASMLIPVADKAKEKGEGTTSPVIEETVAGEWELKAPGLEKIEFIHYKKDFAKPPGTAPKPPSCYKFLTGSKVKWPSTVSYVINPVNPRQILDETFVTSAISASAETWDAATGKELMDGYTIEPTATYGVQNYENAITFGNYPTEGVIAVTTVWYNPATKAIVEFDVMFDTDWTWGDLGDTESSPVEGATVMDLQNIATHELGHGVGLGDIYDSACSAVTMYGYSDYGETQKRTLEQPDITGLNKLYGI